MAWEEIAPQATSKAAPMVSVTVSELKDGRRKLNLFFSTFLMTELGEPKAAKVLVGTDDDAGKIRVVFADDGAFKVGGGGRFHRMQFPAPGFAPARAIGSMPCAILRQDSTAKELDLKLPLEAWSRADAPPKARPDAAPVPAPAAKAGTGPSPSNPLDAEAYLSSKGHKVSRLANDRMAVDGDTLTPGQVLALVNQHRTKADLEPLPRASVR